MLVLSRRTGESVVIGDDVVVTVLEVKGDGGVRLGIDAPRSTRVHRAEVYAAVKAANADASRAAAGQTPPAVEQLLQLATRAARPGRGPAGGRPASAPGWADGAGVPGDAGPAAGARPTGEPRDGD